MSELATAELIRYHKVFSWDCVKAPLVRALVRAAYLQRGQTDDAAAAQTRSEANVRKAAEEILGRPMASRHMSWALDVLRESWVPKLPKEHLAEIAVDIQRTVAPSQASPAPVSKTELVRFIQARNATDNLRIILRAAFNRLHKVERAIQGSSATVSGHIAGPIDLLGEDASPIHEPADHQSAAWAGLDRLAAGRLPETRAGLVILPTGAGKTYTATTWLLKRMEKHPDTRVLWIADRRELVDQAGRAFSNQAECMPPEFRRRMRVMHSGGGPASTLADDKLDIACVTRGSLWSKQGGGPAQSRLRLKAFLKRPTIVVVDEAHHATSPTYRAVLDFIRRRQPDALMIGLTATPWPSGRGKTAQLRRIFPQTVAEVDALTLVLSGFLAKPVLHTLETNAVIKLEEAEQKAAISNDIPAAALGRLNIKSRNNLLVNSWIARRKLWGKTLVFACSIAHADALHDLFRAQKVKSCVVHNRSADELGPALEKFRTSQGPQVLVSVGMLLEGVDVPQARTAFVARPTMSRIVMRQMVGRVLRGEAAGGESEAHIVDLRDRWLSEINPLAPIEVLPLDLQSVEPSDSEDDPNTTSRVLPPIPDDASDSSIDEAIIERIRRAYAELSRDLPHRWAMTTTELVGFYDLGDSGVPIFEHTKAAWADLCAYALKAAGVPAPSTAGKFFEDLPAPTPHSTDLLSVCQFIHSREELPTVETIRSVLSIPAIARRLMSMPPMSEAERTAWLRHEYETSLARAAYPTFPDFLEAVNKALIDTVDDRFSGIDLESPGIPARRHRGSAAPKPKNRDLADIRHRAVIRGRKLLKDNGDNDYLPFLTPMTYVPPVEWTKRCQRGTWAYFRHQSSGLNAGSPIIRVNAALRLTKQQVSDDLLTYLVWHELCHLMLWARGHDVEFHRLQALWPDSALLDNELDTLHERIDFGWARRGRI